VFILCVCSVLCSNKHQWTRNVIFCLIIPSTAIRTSKLLRYSDLKGKRPDFCTSEVLLFFLETHPHTRQTDDLFISSSLLGLSDLSQARGKQQRLHSWSPMKSCSFLKSFEVSWILMKSFEVSWKMGSLMKSWEVSWSLLKSHEVFWCLLKSVEVFWSLSESHEVSWSLMKSCEVSWSLLKSHEVFWCLLKSVEVFWSFVKSFEVPWMHTGQPQEHHFFCFYFNFIRDKVTESPDSYGIWKIFSCATKLAIYFFSKYFINEFIQKI
jgi:hypothetical protein